MGQLIRLSLACGARLQLRGVFLQETSAIESERAGCQKSAVASGGKVEAGGVHSNPGGRRWPAQALGHSGDPVSRDREPATASTCTRHGFFSKSVISISALQSRARLLGAMVARRSVCDMNKDMHGMTHLDGSRKIASCFGSSKPSRSTGSAAPTSPKRVFSACVTASLKRRAVTLALPSSDALPRNMEADDALRG